MPLALGFAFLLGGGILVLAAWTGRSPAAVVKGEAGSSPAGVGGGVAKAQSAAGVSGSATGEVVPAVTGSVSASGIFPPFPHGAGVKRGRTDQGVDYSAPAGTPLYAMGEAIVSHIDPNFYQGQPALYLKYLSGPLAGKETYYSEQITPSVRQGQRVAGGQQVATVAGSGTGLELGWGSGGIPAAHSEYREGVVTHLGSSFESLLAGLGL